MTVDGRNASMIKVNGLLRGVIIPAGSNRVHFYYDRSSFETGRWMSLGAFGTAILLISVGVAAGRFRTKPGI